jgi:simple sugar transport system substrate-binding protein
MKKLRLLSILLVVAFVVPLVVVAPVVAEEPDRFYDKPVNIYLVQHGNCSMDAFWCVVEQGIRDAAYDLGVDVTIISPAEFSPEQTAQDIDKALAASPDALGVTVTDGAMFDEPMRRAVDSGIPVIAYNAADWRPKEERIPYLTYIGQDEYLGGFSAGKRMVEAHPDGVAGVCVNPAVGHVGTDTRCTGWADALAESGIESEVLAITYDASEAVTTMDDFYTANPDVNLWLVQGTGGQDPFFTFVENAGLEPGDIYQAGFDVSPKVTAAILNGTTDFTIDQQPYLQGYMVVQWLTWIERYGLTPPSDWVLTGPGFVDAGNAELVNELAGKVR